MCKSATQKLLWDDRPELKDCFKYFSTEDAAKEYILMNKPVLSLNDVLYNCVTQVVEGGGGKNLTIPI